MPELKGYPQPDWLPSPWENIDLAYPEWINKKQSRGKLCHVDVSAIAGSSKPQWNTWKPHCLHRIIDLIRNGKYDKENFPPVLLFIDDKYFTSDGHHRAIAHKYLQKKRMYAEVIELS